MHSPSSYYSPLPGVPDVQGMATLADRVFPQVFRHDFTQPGFALLSLGSAIESTALRRFMAVLKDALSERCSRQFGKRLGYLSLGRFDQQNTTKFHLDGAPDEAFLMLGYEPSVVVSELAMADYSKAAFDLGISPRQFLTDFNPMFKQGEHRLASYVTRLTAFDPVVSQVLLVNNSSCPFDEAARNQQGVMHQATIGAAVIPSRRVVNSTMMTMFGPGQSEVVGQAIRTIFLTTNEVAGPLSLS